MGTHNHGPGAQTNTTLHSSQVSTHTKEYSEYIPASFVRWLESGGARVIAIHYDTDEAELRHLFDSVNGVLLTGGEILDVANSTYGKTARKLFQWAMESYDAG